MRYAIRYHDGCQEWLVFNVDEQFELVGMHQTEDEAILHAMRLEERDRRREKFINRPALSAA